MYLDLNKLTRVAFNSQTDKHPHKIPHVCTDEHRIKKQKKKVEQNDKH